MIYVITVVAKHGVFHFEGEKPIYCNIHKKNGMINVINKRCKSEWCDT